MNKQTKSLLVILLLVLLILFFLNISLGTKTLNPFNFQQLPATDQKIIMQLRIPRTIAAITAGLTLAASGVLIQAALKNPLADSSILGFQSGATLMAMIIILIFPELYSSLPLFAFGGGLITFSIVFWMTKDQKNAMTIVLAGVAINSIIGAFIGLLSLFFADRLQYTVSWTSGSLNGVSIDEMKLLVGYTCIALVLLFLIYKKLNLLTFDDNQLLNIGINVNHLRLLVATISVFLAAISTSLVGIIGFVGLISPHITRRIVGYDNEQVLPISCLIGAILVTACDLLQRIMLPYYEIPVGATMAIFGGSFFLYLLLKENSNANL